MSFAGMLALASSAAACSVAKEEGCNPMGPASEHACLAGSVLRGKVVRGPTEADLMDRRIGLSSLNVTVRVAAVLKADAGAQGLQEKVPFDAVVKGFQPCCVCGTEPPTLPSNDEYFFFVASECKGSCSPDGTAEFRLSPDSLGAGRTGVTEASEVYVAAGIEADRAKDPCESLYCRENPKCAARGCTAGPSVSDMAATLYTSGHLAINCVLGLLLLLLLHFG